MRARVSDGAGVAGAIVAALCCAGNPLIVAGIAALGLGFIRRDGILWPIMLVSLAIALWGFVAGRRLHGRSLPLALGSVSAVSLAAGVILVHGPPAMQMIYGGAIALCVAVLANILARRAVSRRATRLPA